MSLNNDELRATARELQENHRLTGLDAAAVAADLGVTPAELQSMLAIDTSVDPRMVWRLRDYLEGKVLAVGATPVPYSRLTENMRGAARGWFGV